MDRSNGFLHTMQSMTMKKGNYIIGKFSSNLFLLTALWLFVMISAAMMLSFQFPGQSLYFYDFISPFIGIYPGIIFVSAFAILLEILPMSNKSGNAAGLTVLFLMFLINYSASDYNHPLLRILDFSNYRWIMESINSAVRPLIRRGVQETGILVPGGMFSHTNGIQELFFHGLLWNRDFILDKIWLIIISFALVIFAIFLLELTEREIKIEAKSIKPTKKNKIAPACYTSQFVFEFKLLFKEIPKSVLILITGLWTYSIFAPVKYV